MTPHERWAPEEGSAIVEFLGVAVLLLVPVVYLVLVLGQLQSATFAVEGAARHAARAIVVAEDEATGLGHAEAAVELALRDQGLPPAPPGDALTVVCGNPCLEPGGSVTVTVAVDVVLPGVPAWLDGAVPLHVPVSATHTAAVDSFVAAR